MNQFEKFKEALKDVVSVEPDELKEMKRTNARHGGSTGALRRGWKEGKRGQPLSRPRFYSTATSRLEVDRLINRL